MTPYAPYLLLKRIEKDIAWAIAGGLPDKKKRIPLLGYWTSFQKETAIENMKKSKINNLATVSKSPEHPVWKIYFHFSVDTIEVPELLYILVLVYK